VRDELPETLRARLLLVARRVIERELGPVPLDPDGPSHPELQRHRGAFVTLERRRDGALRGCVGIPEPVYPLADAVARAAVGAAFRDPRFSPVTRGELPGLSVHVSVLSPLLPIASEEVTVGVHGLAVRRAGRSGLLLPQVAVSEGWDRETFLAHTCLKAGLAGDAWRARDCELLAFTAIVFGEGPE
jgi:AmmeMemoRadiSam system protein A